MKGVPGVIMLVCQGKVFVGGCGFCCCCGGSEDWLESGFEDWLEVIWERNSVVSFSKCLVLNRLERCWTILAGGGMPSKAMKRVCSG